MSQLAEDLVAAGHTVTVLTPYPPVNVAAVSAGPPPPREEHGPLRVRRVSVLPFIKVAPMVRAVTHFTLAASMGWSGAWAGRHDVILVYSPPLPLALAAEMLGRVWHAPFILNVQDVYPQALIDLGLVRSRIVLGVLRWLERRAYGRAAAITVHSPGNRDLLMARGVPAAKIRVVPNWVDTRAAVPDGRVNAYRTDLGVGNQTVVLFAGVMGYAQDMGVIIDAATALRDERGIVFVLAGDGVRRAAAAALARARGLGNVRWLPFQPLERYPLLVAASDCCLVTLHASVTTPVVPSKIAGIFAAARPVVAALPPGDARVLVETSGGGVCVAPGDGAALAEAVRRLAHDPAGRRAMGDAGRRYVAAHYARDAATGAYGRLITEVTGVSSVSPSKGVSSGKRQ